MSILAAMSTETPASAQKLILVDGYGFVFRAYHAMSTRGLTSPNGTPVGAVYAFTNMLLKMINDHETDYIAVVFDAGSKTFRNDIYSEYKANRAACPEDLIPQFPLVREAARALNLAIVEKQGYEADDLIATYTKIGRERNMDVVIMSSDKDLMQLIGEGVLMFDPLKSRSIGVAEVQEKFGVAPDKVLDVLALMGDSSDNVPGVPGIGPKTAAELINRFGSLDDVLGSTSEITQQKRRETLEQNKKEALLSRELVRLCYDVPVDSSIEDFIVKKKDGDTLIKFLQEQGFKSLVARMQKSFGSELAISSPLAKSFNNNVPTGRGEILSEIKNLRQWIDSIREIEQLSLHVESDVKSQKPIGLALSVKEKSCYVPFSVAAAPVQTNLFGDAEASVKSDGIEDALQLLKDVLEDKSVLKITHNIKNLLKVAKDNDVNISPVDDIMIMSYTLEAGLHKHDLDDIIVRHYPGADILDMQYSGSIEPEKAMLYACRRSDSMLDIYKNFRKRIQSEGTVTAYEKVEKPLIEVLAEMEINGIKVDPAKLKGLSETFAIEAKRLEAEVLALAGCEFNIGSPKQMGEVLFEQLGLKGGKKSKKTGAYSTDVKVLQDLAEEGHVIAEKILEWRHMSKMMSTYTDSLPKQIKSDGRIHTHFAMAATNTGRLSSLDPNLQNIPIRTEAGNKIREAFVAEKGCKLISADYSQIELRLLAHVAKIGTLQEAFRKDIDIHSATAAQIFGIDVANVDSELRRKAKMINFGIIYGISAFGLAQRLGIGRAEAGDYIKKYFEQYPGIEAYMKETVEFARSHNYVETIWGRKCYINGINDRNGAMRQFSERAAINAPLQGSAADIIKKAMIVLADKLKSGNLKAKILLQVHDELVLEAPENEVEIVAALVKKTMEGVANLSVPITVDVGIGNNWREIH
jgi:DNA polymerase-1